MFFDYRINYGDEDLEFIKDKLDKIHALENEISERKNEIKETLPIKSGTLVYVYYTERENDWVNNTLTDVQHTKLAYIYWNLDERCAWPWFRSVDKDGRPGNNWNRPYSIVEFTYEPCECTPEEAKKILAKAKSKSKIDIVEQRNMND